MNQNVSAEEEVSALENGYWKRFEGCSGQRKECETLLESPARNLKARKKDNPGDIKGLQNPELTWEGR